MDDITIDGAVLLDDVAAYLARYIAYPGDHDRIAHALWIAHTHLMDAWESTPRIAFLSPEPASGKTRAIEMTENLVPRPVTAINATPAYLFRRISDESGPPTLLYDEIDTLFGPRAKDNEEIRGVLNAGHRRGAMAGRCVVRGKTVETEELPAYCAVAIAGLGDLPDTIMTRSVIIRMRRRAPTEAVEPYRRRLDAPEGHRLRDLLAAWADQVRDRLTETWPDMPPEITDRAADVWEALLACADAAGGDWPQQARVAAVAHVARPKDDALSLGVRLLSDIRVIFKDRQTMSTASIIEALIAMDEAPWGDLRGKPIDPRKLSRMLHKYGIEGRTVRIGNSTPRGYHLDDLADAWSRYLPARPEESATSETSTTNGHYSTEAAGNVADVADVAHSAGYMGGCPRCAGEGCEYCDDALAERAAIQEEGQQK